MNIYLYIHLSISWFVQKKRGNKTVKNGNCSWNRFNLNLLFFTIFLEVLKFIMKCTLLQNICILHMSYKLPKYRWFDTILLDIWQNVQFKQFLVPETMSLLHVRSKALSCVEQSLHWSLSMCKTKSANFLFTWMGVMHTLLHTRKWAMQTLLRTLSQFVFLSFDSKY